MVNIFIFPEKNATESFGEKQPEVKGKLQSETQTFIRNIKRVYLQRLILKNDVG